MRDNESSSEPILVNYRGLTALLVKEHGLHEGFWGIYIRFGLRATNLPVQHEEQGTHLMPAAILPVLEIGIQRFPKENDLTVDAAKINPRTKSKATKSSRKTAKKTKK